MGLLLELPTWRARMKPMMYIYNRADELLVVIPIELSTSSQSGLRSLASGAHGTIIKTGRACRFEIENVYPESDFVVHGSIGCLSSDEIQLENPNLIATTRLVIETFDLLI